MSLLSVSLNDRYDLSKQHVLLSGTQALVRLTMMQKARDKEAGHNTAGYVTGYRGSPLGAVDMQMERAQKQLQDSDVKFLPGLNEDLAATAIWGTQQAHLRGEGRFDGVFSMWYGKGPGVDRTGDVFRHANMAGTAELGGVLVAMGDDHTGESSTVLHQSEFALVDSLMPILAPAGVQEILDYGILGWGLSRYSGCWVGLKCVKDTIEVTEVVDGGADRIQLVTPDDFDMPEGGVNIRLIDDRVEQEARLHDHKRFAAEAFARANKIDHPVLASKGATIGIVSSGKSWLDTVHALDLLGIDVDEAEKLGITTYKIGMVWPLDMTSFREWSKDLDLIIVVEEKRKLIEVQIKEALFDNRNGRRVIGWKKENGALLFSVKMALDPVTIARKLGEVLLEEMDAPRLKSAKTQLDDAIKADNAEEIASRLPWFCSGCPHNTSTKIPDGSRAYAGIGCHYMVQWMDRSTLGSTQMGGEGANWIGEAPFSSRNHVFQNIGDGTYNHSGILAIRAAIAAGDINITYKVLYNDAVAMTGGQSAEGDLSAAQVAHELVAMKIKKLAVVYDEKEDIDFKAFPKGVALIERNGLMDVQKELREISGVTAIIYIQTCAAEKRRRRKRGKFPDPNRRVFINPAVCEGCGDCGVQSNCVSILPLETPLGRKRQIDQSSCNKDFSCIDGFCPSFVTLEGAQVRKPEKAALDIPELPLPQIPDITGTYNIVITGVGGTGVVTVGALLAMAAHLEGMGAGVMEMAGLAQKGGAVHIHCRIANLPSDISAIRVAVGEADALIGGDLVTSSGAKTLGLMTRGRTRAVCNSHQINTGEFLKNGDFSLPVDRMSMALSARVGEDSLSMLDATKLAEKYLADAIYANVLMLGAAWQAGLVPLSLEALEKAIDLNGAGVEGNIMALRIGRWAIAFPEDVEAANTDDKLPQTVDDIIDVRADHLRQYQNGLLARRYRKRVKAASAIDEGFGQSVAKGYHKLLAYKDEYEVARLHKQTLELAVNEQLTDVSKMRFHMAPPLLGKKDKQGNPVKTEYGPWMFRAFSVLATLKFLRRTPFDIFGYSAERKMERALIKEYLNTLKKIEKFTPETRDIALALAELPLQIRGFGHIKVSSVDAFAKKRDALLAEFQEEDKPEAIAAE